MHKSHKINPRLWLVFCAFCAFLRPIVWAQPAPVLADPITGALFRPTAALFATGNGLVTSAAAAAAYQPLDADLTAIAALTTTANGRSLLTVSALTGTGNAVLSASPTLTGTISAASLALTGDLTSAGAGASSFKVGPSSSAAGQESVAVGNGAAAAGTQSIALGGSASAAGNLAVVIGYSSSTASGASGQGAIAIGYNVDNVGSDSTAVGYQAQATSLTSVAMGSGANAGTRSTSNDNVAIGDDAKVRDDLAAADLNGVVLVARQATSKSTETIAIGHSASIGVSASGAIAIGSGTVIPDNGQESIVVGRGATATSSSQFVLGSGAQPLRNAFLGGGVTATSPVSFKLNWTGASGTDVATPDVEINAGKSTGTGTGGRFLFQTTRPAASTSSSANSLETRLTVDSSATSGVSISLPSGYSSTAKTVGTGTSNSAQSTAATPFDGLSAAAANIGAQASAIGSGNGANVGMYGGARAALTGVGVLGDATFGQNNNASAVSVGAYGAARRAHASAKQIGVAGTLYSATPTLASAAGYFDNADQTSPIFIAADNGSSVFTIADGGAVTSTGAVSITNATGATSTGTGALIVTGGAGVGGALWVGGVTNFAGTVTVGTGAERLQYNTADQATNYERGFSRWVSNRFEFGTEKGGSGTLRDVNVIAGTGIITFGISSGTKGAIEMDVGSLSGNNPVIRLRPSGNITSNDTGVMGVMTDMNWVPTAGTGTFIGLGVFPTVNSTGTVSGSTFAALRVSPVMTSTTGLTSMLLLDLGTNSGSAGSGTHTSLFSVNSAGVTTVAKVLATTPSALTYASPTSVDVTLANVYTVTTVNATGSVTFNATAGGTAGQRIVFIITNDATSAKTITFGTNFSSMGTLTPAGASKVATIEFISNGTTFYELCRSVIP